MRIRYMWLDRHYLINKRKESVQRWIVWKLPKRLVMWAFFRVAAHATSGKYGSTVVSEITMMDAIDRYMRDNNLGR